MFKPTLPTTLFRVYFWQGYGWPECTRRERTFRTYPTPERAAQMVETVRRWPSHHKLIGVWQASAIEWEQIDPATLPEPPEPEEETDE